MNNFDAVCRSGNTMIDSAPKDYPKVACVECRGEGFVPWETLSELFEHIDHHLYYMKKNHLGTMTFVQILKMARKWWAVGKTCEHCEGTGIL